MASLWLTSRLCFEFASDDTWLGPNAFPQLPQRFLLGTTQKPQELGETCVGLAPESSATRTMAEVSTKVPSFLLLFSMVASFRVGEPVPAPAQKRVLGARRGGGGHTERELRPSPPLPPPELSAGTEMQVGPEPEPPSSSASFLFGLDPVV